jgi:hypothetical protein
MASGKAADRKAKLAAALKQNLKRRKTATAVNNNSSEGVGLGAGVAPQTGLKPLSGKSPKTASKRN